MAKTSAKAKQKSSRAVTDAVRPLAKILWAVDAMQCTSRTIQQVTRAIAAYAGPRQVRIEPVYILTPETTSLPIAWFEEALPRLRREALDRINAALGSRAGLNNFTSPKILVERSQHSIKSIERLNRYAASAEAEAIVVSTHGRTGVARLFIGSFAESLLLHARTSVLVINPTSKSVDFKKRLVLHAIDLVTEDHQILLRVTNVAADSNSRLILYHALPPALKKLPETVASIFTAETARRRKLADKLASKARERGLRVETVLSPTDVSVSEAIIKAAAENKATLIALASRGTPLRAAFAGSVARQVVRAAPCPVLVLHAPAADKR